MYPPFFNPFFDFSSNLEETKTVLADRFLTEEETRFFFERLHEYNRRYFAGFQFWFISFLERVIRMENFNFYSYSPLSYWWENQWLGKRSNKISKRLGDQGVASFFTMVDNFISVDKDITEEERSQLLEISQVCKIKAKKNWSHVANFPGGIL